MIENIIIGLGVIVVAIILWKIWGIGAVITGGLGMIIIKIMGLCNGIL